MQENPNVTPKTNNSTTRVLASWSYSVAEWRQFRLWEKKQKSAGIILETAVIFMLGVLVAFLVTKGNWITSLISGASASLIYGSVKYIASNPFLEIDPGHLPEVIITEEAVLVNGKSMTFSNHTNRLGHVAIREAKGLNVLEISYCMENRQGILETARIRVPIQKGKLREAIRVQEELAGTRPE